MNKKTYTCPVVKKVTLVSKNTVLGFCHSSPNMFPKDSGFLCSDSIGGCPTTP